MRIIAISDTHTKHDDLTEDLLALHETSNDETIIIHAGDISNRGEEYDVLRFLDWFGNLPFTHKVFIAGNHDFYFERNSDIPQEYKERGITYLFDNMVEIEGIKIYGSPWQPRFFDWAFNVNRGDAIAERWASIPTGLDILVTHGPAFGILDYTYTGIRAGCEELFKKIMEVKPRIHCSGHIHYARGMKEFNDTLFINASNLGENYQYSNKPIAIEYDSITKNWDYVSFE